MRSLLFMAILFFIATYPERGWVRLITLIYFGVEAFSHTICVSPSRPLLPSFPQNLVGPAFLIATELINLILASCNNLTC